MKIVTTAVKFNTRPSLLLHISGEYESYCFDEACAYLITQIEQEKIPMFKESIQENKMLKLLMAE